MASYQKRVKNGGVTWRAFIRRKGSKPVTASFSTKAAAQAWVSKREAEIRDGNGSVVPDKTFGQLLEKYRDEVSEHKKGYRWEKVRIAAMLRDQIAFVPLRELDTPQFANWRDRRLRGSEQAKAVSVGTVRREWNLLSGACTIAVREWKWLRFHPMKGVKLPPKPRARDVLFTDDQIERLGFALGWSDTAPQTVSARVHAAFLFAIQTAMRAGEIAGLTWDQVGMEARVAHLDKTKNGDERDVPLSSEAMRIIRLLEEARDGESVFGVDTSQVDALFRKARTRTQIKGVTFHDSRHTAITRLAKKLDVLPLARMVGHRDLNSLLTYYNEPASAMVERLG